MPQYTAGDLLPDFSYQTPFQSGLSIHNTVQQAQGKTAIVFLRYYGCTLCQLGLHAYAQAYGRITQNGGQLLVVLQSSPEKLAEQLQPESFPFPIICDPDKKLYQLFSISSAPSALRMMSPSAIAKGVKAMAKGYKHGAYEGDELQLPAAFVTTRDCRLTYVHYGRDAGDAPTADMLVSLLA